MKLLVDVDTGVDDALALLYLADAQRRGEVELVGAGTVGGNADIGQTTRNTLRVLELAGLDVPVAAGAARPLFAPLAAAPHVHGDDGLADTGLEPPRRRASGEHAVDQILGLSHVHAGELTVLATGPLTNLAQAFLLDPGLAGRLRRVVVMGGSLGAGNVTAVAEANVRHDPEAARAVFASGVPLTMVGLDVTRKTCLEARDLAPLEELGTERARFALHLVRHLMDAYGRLGRPRQCMLHDPLAAGVCLDPLLVITRRLHVDVETRGELTRGMTVADRRAEASPAATVDVALGVDARRFKERFLAALVRWAGESAARPLRMPRQHPLRVPVSVAA